MNFLRKLQRDDRFLRKELFPLIVAGWNNGSPDNKTGAGYGVRLSPSDRDNYFQKNWKTVTVFFDGASVDCNLSDAFWAKCPELRSSKIGKWMLNNKLAPWPKGKPPQLRLDPIGNRQFRLT
jgi:hypothetical protein